MVDGNATRATRVCPLTRVRISGLGFRAKGMGFRAQISGEGRAVEGDRAMRVYFGEGVLEGAREGGRQGAE